MHRHLEPRRISADLCFGRDQLCQNVVKSALDAGAVLLFGGRQAGKTTILKRIERNLAENRCDTDELRHLSLPVYADLMRLPYDATPYDFFRMLSTLALAACRKQIDRFDLRSLPDKQIHTGDLLDLFIADMQTIFQATGNVTTNFVFLLDEAKRVLRDRFPRGFQDNLFSLLFSDHSISSRFSIVFAGAQDLYRFCEDDTSPIGSRAEKHLITNLDEQAVTDLVKYSVTSGEIAEQRGDNGQLANRATLIFSETGGHAGLSSYLSFKLASSPSSGEADLNSAVHSFQLQHSELFRLWTARFSVEARLISEELIIRNQIDLSEAAEILARSSMSSFDADRVFDELLFTGLASRRDDTLFLANRMYARNARNYIIRREVANETERPVWNLLEELELNLRKLVWQRFNQKWPGKVNHQIQMCLGDETWETIEYNKNRYEKSYNGVGKDEHLNTLDFTYLGQLGQLMTWKSAWDSFKSMFRDKRDLEDMLRDITPVRNDSAHFRKVPKKELDRCRLRCEDLSSIVERELSTD